MSSIDELFEFYRDECVPAYSDLVGYLADKPAQFLVEIENSFAHVAQYFNPEVSIEDREKNIAKARDHLMRVTLDSYKLLWVIMDGDLEEICKDEFKRKYCINMSYGDFYNQYKEFKRRAQEARRIETENIGIDPLRALNAYKDVINIGRELVNNIDYQKIESAESDLRVISFKRNALELTISFIAGLLSSWIILMLTK